MYFYLWCSNQISANGKDFSFVADQIRKSFGEMIAV